jgi:hypothetical protein
MGWLHGLARRLGQEWARKPIARAKAAQVLAETQRVLNDDIKPRAAQAWRDVQPEVQNAKREVKRVAQELRDEYRKGRDGE